MAQATDFTAVNVALYRPGGDRWVMTERRSNERSREAWRLGTSSLDASSLDASSHSTSSPGTSSARWEDGALVLEFDERCAPLPSRLRGTVRITPRALDGAPVALDGERGRHRWYPIAPSARAQVSLDDPGLTFVGESYVDANEGDEPLEAGFSGWIWSRMSTARGTTVAYRAVPRQGAPLELARHYDRSGQRTEIADVARHALPRTRWGLSREVACDAGARPRLARRLEDTPFYARSLVETRIAGHAGMAMHEVLDLDRFGAGWVRFLLPFRARRE